MDRVYLHDDFEKRRGAAFLRTFSHMKKGNIVIPFKTLSFTIDNTFFLVFCRPYDSLCFKMGAKMLLDEICCRVLGKLCSTVYLVSAAARRIEKLSLCQPECLKLAVLKRFLDLNSHSCLTELSVNLPIIVATLGTH